MKTDCVSQPTPLQVVHDTISPTIQTKDTLQVQENTKIVDVIDALDSHLVNFYLDYTLDGYDTSHFVISHQGELALRDSAFDFENPYDKDGDNSYTIRLFAQDEAGNRSYKDLSINVEDTMDAKPKIDDATLNTSIYAHVSDTIGNISFQKGDGEFVGFELNGTGSQNFEIDKEGNIRLIKHQTKATQYTLSLKAINSFGFDEANLTINVTNFTRIAKVSLGQLTNATVKIYTLHSDSSKELIAQTNTNEQGDFDLHTHLLEDENFYIYEIRGGVALKTDTNEDGIEDDFAVTNQGVLRLILKKEWLTHNGGVVHISALSEILYLYSVDTINNNYHQLDKQMAKIAKTILMQDLNSDGKIDAQDAMIFNPTIDSQALNASIQKRYLSIVNQILDNISSRYKYIFDTKVIKRFDQNATGCGPSMLCGFELKPTKIKYHNHTIYSINNSRLFIYDTKADKTLSSIAIPSDEYGLYLDLDKHQILLSAQNKSIVTVDISTLNQPKRVDGYLSHHQGYILGKMDSSYLIYQANQLRIVDTNKSFVYDLPLFNQIVAKNGYSFDFDSRGFILNRYDLSHLESIVQVGSYRLEGIGNDAQMIMDEMHTIYILTPNQSLQIYAFTNGNFNLLSTQEINATTIIAHSLDTLYLYGDHKIYQMDCEYLDRPKINAVFSFEQTTSQLYFDGNLLYTPRYLINLDALILSSPYMRLDTIRSYNREYDIELETIKDTTIFEPF